MPRISTPIRLASQRNCMSKILQKKGWPRFVIYPDYMATGLGLPRRALYFLEQQDWYRSARDAERHGYAHWSSNRIPYVSVHEIPLPNIFHQGPLSRFWVATSPERISVQEASCLSKIWGTSVMSLSSSTKPDLQGFHHPGKSKSQKVS